MISYLIIDDEHIAHDIIKGYCDLLPNMELQKNCYDALEALDYLNKQSVDLIFLDINMPKLKGFEFLKTLKSPPKVIVTTAYQEYALEGYELNVSDYLLKPFSFERFLKAINKTLNSTDFAQKTTTSIAAPTNKSVFLRSNKKYTQVFIDQIKYIEAAGNYTKIVTTSETITVRDKITDTLDVLENPKLIRVHKSFAVTSTYIKNIEGNRIVLEDVIIPIGKTFKMNVDKILG